MREPGIRLSTHPGQCTVINGPDPAVVAAASRDLEQERSSSTPSYEALSDRARRRLALEHDETAYDNRRRPGPVHADPRDALPAAMATWPEGVRPKAHLSSPRTELRTQVARVSTRHAAAEERLHVAPGA